MTKKSSKKTTPSNTNTQLNKAPKGMSLAPSHQSAPDTVPGTRPGVTVTVEPPPADFVAETVAADMGTPPSAANAKVERARKLKGIPREQVMALCQASGLAHLPKGTTDMFGDQKGARLVVPKGSSVTKLFVYRLERADLPGYHTAEQRKDKGIGSVSHIVDAPTLDTVKTLLTALTRAQDAAGDNTADPALEAPTPEGDASEGTGEAS